MRIATGRPNSAARTFHSDSLVKTSQWTVCPMTRFASAIDTASGARSSRSLSRASHAIAWASEWQNRRWLLCWCRTTGPGSTFACWRKATSAPATKSRKWRMAPNASQWPTWMPSRICQTPRRPTRKLVAGAGAQPGLEIVFKGARRAANFGGRESRAQGLQRAATSLAGFSAITRRQSRSGNCQCGLVVHRRNGRNTSARGSTRAVSGSTVAHNTHRPHAAAELLDVRNTRRQDLSDKRETGDERACQLVSFRARKRWRCFGGERTSGRVYSEIRRCSSRLAQRRHRGNPRTRHVALAILHGVTP